MPFQFHVGCAPTQDVVNYKGCDRDNLDGSEHRIVLYKHQRNNACDDHDEHIPVVDAAGAYVTVVALTVDYVVDFLACHVMELWSSELFSHTA